MDMWCIWNVQSCKASTYGRTIFEFTWRKILVLQSIDKLSRNSRIAQIQSEYSTELFWNAHETLKFLEILPFPLFRTLFPPYLNEQYSTTWYRTVWVDTYKVLFKKFPYLLLIQRFNYVNNKTFGLSHDQMPSVNPEIFWSCNLFRM